jgi:Fe-S cluster biogenesis protein NfuA
MPAADSTKTEDLAFEVARKIAEKHNARFPKKIKNILTWQEYLKSLGLTFEIDHSRPYAQFNFIHEKDSPQNKAKKIESRKDYMLSGAFVAASMTDAIIIPENGTRRVEAKHHDIIIAFEKSETAEKFVAKGLQGNLKSPAAQTEEAYLNNTLLETAKTAFLLVQNAKLAGFDPIMFGNTTDPCRRYALKLACDALGVDCSAEKIDMAALPSFACLNIPVQKRMEFWAEEYLNFPNDAPRFDKPKVEEIKVEAEKTDDPKTRRFIIHGLTVAYGDVDIDRARESGEVAEQIVDAAFNPLVKDWLKNPFLVRMSYRHGEKAVAEITLSDQKDWDAPASTALPSKLAKSFAETFRAGLEMKLKARLKNAGTAEDSLFDKECAIAYTIERSRVQEAVRAHNGFLQFGAYDAAAKEVVIYLGGSCNDGCNLIGNTTEAVQKMLLASFPKDVKNVSFLERPAPKI